MTANTMRGEVVFNVGGQSFTLRPTFEALVKIEGIVGRSFFEYVQNLNAGSAKLTEVAAIVSACSVDPMTKDEAGSHIFDFGVVSFLNGPFAELIMRGAGFYEGIESAGGSDGDEGKR